MKEESSDSEEDTDEDFDAVKSGSEEDTSSEEDDDSEEESSEDSDGGEEEGHEEGQPKLKFESPFLVGDKQEPGVDSGCTAVVALIRYNELYVANAGDSRCVVCRNGKAIEMSCDHKPEDDTERLRIENAGGKVTPDGRVNGGLNLSRALGDHFYKQNKDVTAKEQMISALPDIRTLTISPGEDEFLVIACDGIWNSMSSQEVVDFVRERLTSESDKISPICEELFDKCLAPQTTGDGTGCDNMTCIVVKFGNLPSRSDNKRTIDSDETLQEAKRTKLEDDNSVE